MSSSLSDIAWTAAVGVEESQAVQEEETPTCQGLTIASGLRPLERESLLFFLGGVSGVSGQLATCPCGVGWSGALGSGECTGEGLGILVLAGGG